MSLKYVSLQFKLPSQTAQLPTEIEARLLNFGKPIRWALTQVNDNICEIEGVVMVEDP